MNNIEITLLSLGILFLLVEGKGILLRLLFFKELKRNKEDDK
jgi:hypothetical protein